MSRGRGCLPFLKRLCPLSRHEPERPSFEVLAVAYDDGVHISHAVGPPHEAVDMPRATAPQVGVGGLHDHASAISRYWRAVMAATHHRASDRSALTTAARGVGPGPG